MMKPIQVKTTAKTLGLVGAVVAVILGVAAYVSSSLFWGALALIWAARSVVNFRTARGRHEALATAHAFVSAHVGVEGE